MYRSRPKWTHMFACIITFFTGLPANLGEGVSSLRARCILLVSGPSYVVVAAVMRADEFTSRGVVRCICQRWIVTREVASVSSAI